MTTKRKKKEEPLQQDFTEASPLTAFLADFAHDGGTDGNKLHRVEAPSAVAALEWARLNPPVPGYSVVAVYVKVWP